MRRGLIKTALGTAVTGTALMSSMDDIRKKGLKKRNVNSTIGTAFLGFGLAHIVLGTIDYLRDK